MPVNTPGATVAVRSHVSHRSRAAPARRRASRPRRPACHARGRKAGTCPVRTSTPVRPAAWAPTDVVHDVVADHRSALGGDAERIEGGGEVGGRRLAAHDRRDARRRLERCDERASVELESLVRAPVEVAVHRHERGTVVQPTEHPVDRLVAEVVAPPAEHDHVGIFDVDQLDSTEVLTRVSVAQHEHLRAGVVRAQVSSPSRSRPSRSRSGSKSKPASRSVSASPSRECVVVFVRSRNGTSPSRSAATAVDRPRKRPPRGDEHAIDIEQESIDVGMSRHGRSLPRDARCRDAPALEADADPLPAPRPDRPRGRCRAGGAGTPSTGR